MLSRVSKQGHHASGTGNDETHCSGPVKNAPPVGLVGTKSRMKRRTNIAGSKPGVSKQIEEVKKQRRPGSVKIGNTNTVGLEKVVPLVPGRKVKAPTTISRAAAGGRVEARLVTPGRMQRHNDTLRYRCCEGQV